MRLRLRGPSGSSSLTLPSDTATIQDLFDVITERTAVSSFDIKIGYPPQPLRLDQDDRTTLLSSVGTRLDGEQLIISAKDAPAAQRGSAAAGPDPAATDSKPVTFSAAASKAPRNAPPSESPAPPSQPLPRIPLPPTTHPSSHLTLLPIPDDNSCLFRSLSTALLTPSLDSATELRSLVASTIQSQASVYTRAILDNQDPDDYCRWITTQDAWGGGIELSILSTWFGVEISVIDVQSGRVERFNELKEGRRVVLVYSGIHYDCAVVVEDYTATGEESAPSKKVFDINDAVVLTAAVELCAALRKKGYYTDTKAFDVRCNVCGAMVRGEKGVSEHAMSTGHSDFGEETGRGS